MKQQFISCPRRSDCKGLSFEETSKVYTPRPGSFRSRQSIGTVFSNSELLIEYQAQQSTERDFRIKKDPLFFTICVFLKSPKRITALAMVMGLSLLVYSLGQRALRLALAQAQQTISPQLGQPTASPTFFSFLVLLAVNIICLIKYYLST